MLAVVFAWTAPAWAGPQGSRGKKDQALEQHLKSGGGQAEYRVIIETVDHSPASGNLAIRMAGGRKFRRLMSFPGDVAVVTEKQLEKLERHPLVKAIYLDRPTQGLLERTNATIGSSAVRNSWGYTGRGVGVAVIDSGITGWHDDLTTQGAGQRVSAFVDFVGGQLAAHDDYGHGTHVAGIIAGNGYDSYGRHAGVAPGAKVAALKVLDGNGAGYMSDVIAAIDWTIANKAAYGLRVVNLSVGATVTQSYHADPLALSAKRAVDSGLVVVAAAGNRGRNAAGQTQYGGITAPGNAPWVITVGNANTQGTTWRWDDTVAASSSRGPTPVDFSAKPDLVAPGTGIVSLNTAGSTLSLQYASAVLAGTRLTAYPPYLSLSGTSMAAPVVSGTVALMLEANPSLTPNAVKAILEYTAQTKRDISPLAQGAGFLNAWGAVRMAKYFRNPEGSYPSSWSWGRTLLWGNYRVKGGRLDANASAFATNIVWGTLDADNIVWGTVQRDGDNIVWGTLDGDNIVWGTLDADNIVWGTLDNIVWGTLADGDNIVWGTDCGGADCAGVVWGTLARDGDNIVWGTVDNIVWGTAAEGDNIVWGTACADGDNIVWGTSDDEAGVEAVVWSPAPIDDVPFEELFEPDAGEDGSATQSGTSLTGIVGGGL